MVFWLCIIKAVALGNRLKDTKGRYVPISTESKIKILNSVLSELQLLIPIRKAM
jgi:hypothetical protein